jgi:hypothetical protein
MELVVGSIFEINAHRAGSLTRVVSLKNFRCAMTPEFVSADDLKLVAPDPASPFKDHFVLPLAADQNPKPPINPELQFSLRELFGVMTFAAVMFTGFQWMSPAAMAFATGIASCVTLACSAWLPARRTTLVMAWWVLLFTYILACCVALNSPAEKKEKIPTVQSN